jgi:hypothetical protein
MVDLTTSPETARDDSGSPVDSVVGEEPWEQNHSVG